LEGATGALSGNSTPGSAADLTHPGASLGDQQLDGGGFTLGSAGTGDDLDKELEGRPFEKNMLEECRSVDEYEKLNRISGGVGVGGVGVGGLGGAAG